MGSSNRQYKHPLVTIAWNGVEEPCKLVESDELARFSVLLFNYSGNGAVPPAKEGFSYNLVVNRKTEFKGHLLRELNRYLANHPEYDIIGIMDDDIRIKVSSINRILDLAAENELDVCQPSLTHDSYHSFLFNLHRPGTTYEEVPWVEIMCPFYRRELFDACYPLADENISSYGIDNYVIPFYQQVLNMKRSAVIHAVQATHTKPVTDGDKRFSNGLTAREEGEKLRKKICRLIYTVYAGRIPEQTARQYFGDHTSVREKLRVWLRVSLKRMKILPLKS
jgi:hypothetical protein